VVKGRNSLRRTSIPEFHSN